jgi:hypothetical protein
VPGWTPLSYSPSPPIHPQDPAAAVRLAPSDIRVHNLKIDYTTHHRNPIESVVGGDVVEFGREERGGVPGISGGAAAQGAGERHQGRPPGGHPCCHKTLRLLRPVSFLVLKISSFHYCFCFFVFFTGLRASTWTKTTSWRRRCA